MVQGSTWNHGSVANTAFAPSERWGTTDDSVLFQILLSSNGYVGISPDYLGYGDSYEYFKSFLVKKAYQTSFVPLWLKAQQIIATETSCQSELANDVVVTGYSEGGFAAVAISDAMHCMGVNVIKMLVGGAPYQIASEQFLSMHDDIKNQKYPESKLNLLVLMGTAYSARPDLLNVKSIPPQLLLANSWTDADGTTFSITDTISKTMEGASFDQLNKYLNTYPSDPLDVFNPVFDAWLEASHV